ncbi:MAG: haloacid dehalogenase-like hydrolase [Negativicutes bacterium]|nr:haloacid dehalogenase-like hydrolase [Negativicutes bacterium]
MGRRRPYLFWLFALLAVLVLTAGGQTAAAELGSWRDNDHRQAIIAYVTAVTDPESPDYVPPAERVAVFDNDGTIIPEKPYSFIDMFAARQVQRLYGTQPEWQNNAWARKLFSALPAEFDEIRQTMPAEEFGKIFAAGNGGQDQRAVEQALHDYVYGDTSHPRWHKPPAALLYRPMKELIAYLQEHQFSVYLVSGSTTDYLRQFCEQELAIDKSHVIGWDFVDEVRYDGQGQISLYKTTEPVVPVPLREGKPVNIARHIGRRPLVAVGNSSGDIAMLTYTRGNNHPTLCLIVSHDDPEREYAYDFGEKVWAEAARQGWIVVSMKGDFAEVF